MQNGLTDLIVLDSHQNAKGIKDLPADIPSARWDDAEKTAEAIDANGWMHTGDLATMDDDGYCKIVGGIKDMVIRGGENIYPREIEEFLYRHPAVQDVQVFGVPDKR